MTLLLLATDPELLDLARLLLTAAREVPRRRQRFGPVEVEVGFGCGPAWAWCPAEEYETPSIRRRRAVLPDVQGDYDYDDSSQGEGS